MGYAYCQFAIDGNAKTPYSQLEFFRIATLAGIVLMYYVDFYSLFNNPEKDWENMKIFDKNPPPLLTLFV